MTTCLQHKLYSSIDTLPQWNWIQAHETGDMSYLVQKRRLKHPNYHGAWRELYTEYFKRFGITPEYAAYLNKLRKATIAMADVALRNDPVAHIDLHILKKEIEVFHSKTEKIDFYNNNAALEKFMGFRLDPKKVSVSEYQGKVNLMRKAAQDAERERQKRQQQNGR